MEKHNDLTNNTIQDWINSDKKLSGILTEIENLAKSEEEQASIAFHRLSDEYNVPKYPDDVKDREMIQVADWHLYTPLARASCSCKLCVSPLARASCSCKLAVSPQLCKVSRL